MTAEPLMFFILAACAVVSAVLMVIQRSPVMSAVYLIANFFCLALLYLLLHAQLLAVLQIVVYAGAIMVLFVFVIMLLNLADERALAERIHLRVIIGVIIAGALLLELLYLFTGSAARGAVGPAATTIGTVEEMGVALFGRFLLPFEVTSLLLLAAIIGAVILAKKRQ